MQARRIESAVHSRPSIVMYLFITLWTRYDFSYELQLESRCVLVVNACYIARMIHLFTGTVSKLLLEMKHLNIWQKIC